MLSIQTSLASLNASRVLTDGEPRLQRTIAHLSSGSRISSARDDAAGLAISSRMQGQSRAFNANLRNINDMVSLFQVAEGALSSSSENLQRIRELAVQAANGTNTLDDRLALQAEANQLMEASRHIQANTEFNGRKLLDGTFQIPSASGTFTMPAINIAPVFQGILTDNLFRLARLYQADAKFTPSGALSIGDLTINKKAIGASTAGSGVGQTAASAWAIAQAIGNVQIPDISVSASTTITGSAIALPGAGLVQAGDISINGVPVQAGYITNAINGISGQTGVSAQLALGASGLYTLTLTAADGRNIDVSGAGSFGLNDTSAVGSVRLIGPIAEQTGANLTIGGNAPGNAGFGSSTVLAADTGQTLVIPTDEDKGYDLNPNLLSFEAAQVTISSMDRKLGRLTSTLTSLGATLNVLDFESSYMAASNETVQAANSRISDTDYATETASLARARLVQSAGLAMAAQANSNTSRILQLLLRNIGS